MQGNLGEAERRIAEARATQAKCLDLGDLALSDLPITLGDLPNLMTLCLGKGRISEVGEVGEVVWDWDRKRANFTNLSPLAGLRELKSLDLRGTSVRDLAPLAGLQVLESVNLAETHVKDLSALAGLRELKSLDLWDTGVTDLSPLSGLRMLQVLSLSSTGVTDLSPLSGLHKLFILFVPYSGVTDLAPLSGLQQLQCLNLSYCAGVTDLSPLAGLHRLWSLLCWDCVGITDLSPLSKLEELQELDLMNCRGVTDLSPLAGLQKLQKLGLSNISVTDISYLAGLQGLQILSLSGTGVKDLSPLAGLHGLQSLTFSYCSGATDLAPVAGLKGLQTLDLHHSQSAVPTDLVRGFAELPLLAKLVVDEAVGVPREVLSHDYNDNCLPRLRTYFAELDLGAEAENEVKVILLGNGGVGKSQLCRRFRNETFDESVESTHGVQLWRRELKIRTGGQEQVFQVNWWDFGGQDIYHGTHALFLRSRAVFLILWTPRLENREEYFEGGIPLRNQPLSYWLEYVRTLAGQDRPVIVVQSQCDRFEDRRPAVQALTDFGFFESCCYSAKENLGREALEAHLRDAIRYLFKDSGALEIGHGRAEVRRRLYSWRSQDQKRKPEKRKHRTLTLEQFQALCDEVGGVRSWEHALQYFHDTGVLFYQPSLFANAIVLDQTWALDAIYTVFDRGRAAPLLRDSGRFTREDLSLLVWHGYSLEEQRLFLGLMESCRVCFPCGKTAQGEWRHIAPDLLPQLGAVEKRLELYGWKDQPGMAKLRLEYRFFHPAVIRDVMSAIGWRAGDIAEYWKYGFWLKDGHRDSQVVVELQDIHTSDAPGAGALELKAQGRDPLGLMREISNLIRRQRLGGPAEERLTLEGRTVARSALTHAIEGRVLDAENKSVAAAAYAAFFENREGKAVETSSEPTPRIDFKPVRPTVGEKPREVFISYAWGDKSKKGKIRSETVERLFSALDKDGFCPVRDRDELRPGEPISAFIRRLTKADLVVAVISNRYLRSWYCMYEIYRLWQRSRADAGDLVRHLVPIMLPEVKIGDLPQRARYIRFWRDRKTKLEGEIRDLGLQVGSKSWEEVRLVQEFAHHVDDILVFLQDVLMPRNLEAHFKDGFEAVRDALRERVRTDGGGASLVAGDDKSR